MDLKEKVINQLKKYDIEILNQFKSEDEEIIVTEDFSLGINETTIFISYYVGVLPSIAARISTILIEIEGIETLEIGPEYIFDENGNIITGDEAIQIIEGKKRDEIINDFVNNQRNAYILQTAHPFNC